MAREEVENSYNEESVFYDALDLWLLDSWQIQNEADSFHLIREIINCYRVLAECNDISLEQVYYRLLGATFVMIDEKGYANGQQCFYD